MKKINTMIYFYFQILFLEVVSKIVMTGSLLNIGLLYVVVFSLSFSLILFLITSLFKEKTNKVITIILSLIITIYFSFQYVFFSLFSVPFSFNTIGLANAIVEFNDIIKDTLTSNILYIIIYLIPLLILLVLILIKRFSFKKNKKEQNIMLVILFLFSLLADYIYLMPNKEKFDSPYNLYTSVDDSISIINQFGVLTYTEVDVNRVLFGYETELIDEVEDNEIDEFPGVTTYDKNITNIDFDYLLANESNETLQEMHKYFNNASASYKNEYTGMFKDKNLIFILAEGFNEVAVDEVRTPTLYKLIHEGFNFTNFYSPVFLSTTGGEFQATTGLVPTQEILKNWKSLAPSMNYSLGHSFNALGYNTKSFHNWTYTYYQRDVTMKTLGFNNYMGCGNGMEKLLKCDWLPSDIDMFSKTTPLYQNEQHFMTYYVTVSGHSPYVSGANIVKKHYETVKDLDMSKNIKNYLASQVELDKALETLINSLQASGTLDNTVIALVGDHYPYTLSIDEMNEAATYKKDSIVEVNHSNFILWNNNMEPVTIDKVGSQIDVLPTLLNLFGIDYDSRLIVGKDILSTYEGLAIFSNRSWVTDKGTYFYSSKKFVPKDDVEVDEEYINRINKRVSNAFTMSKLIIDNNYYDKVVPK